MKAAAARSHSPAAKASSLFKTSAPWSLGRLVVVLLIAVFVWLIACALALCVGSTGTFTWPSDGLILSSRFERVLIASIVGAGLASAGVAYQASLRNDLAEPYLLGVASGAALASYLWMWPAAAGVFVGIAGGSGAVAFALVMALGQQAFAFIGAMLAVLLVFAVARARDSSASQGHAPADTSSLILVGVVLSTIVGAVILTLAQFMRAVPGMTGVEQFIVGGIRSDIGSAAVILAAILFAIGFIYLLSKVNTLNVIALGDEQALSLGLDCAPARRGLLVVSSLIASAAVALAGPIGFVGLICPHAARRIVGHDHRLLLPAATSLGAVLLVLADAVSRMLAREALIGQMLPVGVITAVVGGPMFLLLLSRQGRRA